MVQGRGQIVGGAAAMAQTWTLDWAKARTTAASYVVLESMLNGESGETSSRFG